MTIEALIFDFDGLLMDTERTLLDSWRWEWRQHGLELDESGFFAEHGGDVSELRYAELARAVGAGYDRAASHARRMAYREEVHATLGLSSGIASWLGEAERRGLRLAVASSSPGSWVRSHLQRTGDLARFEVLACGDEVPGHKPDPAVYRLALDRLGLSADRAVAFEDSPHGVDAAQAAGLRCVAIPNPFTPEGRYAHADVLLPSAATTILSEVLSRIERIPSRSPDRSEDQLQDR
ncbi:putative hydrolase of the HAD superfamily [Actinoplanes octamycinicus]|uniref:Putative hydrolase of the HAD superfamily n=1 Tax=Actinoplanes octamycinicus TaxID=135948 RepID=A0A7W7H685_9ACTN|nr:HAD-IA family hydrolase [Actinoplanes octamycinicus]MBB4744599.1 putative hydrolase of the HAD superfamily [Actinoplanes octamycinicus]GIE63830.1 haloacid dehalogenase [Actinoplanes octamycinicus]